MGFESFKFGLRSSVIQRRERNLLIPCPALPTSTHASPTAVEFQFPDQAFASSLQQPLQFYTSKSLLICCCNYAGHAPRGATGWQWMLPTPGATITDVTLTQIEQ